MVFEQLAQAVLGFVNWGITIVLIMLVWEIIQFIRGGSEERDTGSSGVGKKSLSEIKEGFNKWTGRDEVEKKKKITRDAAREETSALNEYIAEETELKHLDDAVVKAQECLKLVGDAQTSPATSPAKIINVFESISSKFKEVNRAVQAAENQTKELTRTTWRERRKMKELLKSLDDADVSKGDLDSVRALEDQVLKRHDYVITNLASAVAALHRGDSTAKKLSSNAKNEIPKKTIYLTTLRELFYKEVIPMLQKAQGGQRSAYKDTQDLISRIRKVWK
ncbi:MAG: hypothetical protein Q7K45_04095 [Nanoarchaeota archaeon]|nr:hypothetical protein [Nanoarchaeota archaeon]